MKRNAFFLLAIIWMMLLSMHQNTSSNGSRHLFETPTPTSISDDVFVPDDLPKQAVICVEHLTIYGAPYPGSRAFGELVKGEVVLARERYKDQVMIRPGRWVALSGLCR